jgi:class 3 adenylate cyclase/tetratricopeptide (TPR) repeat protein
VTVCASCGEENPERARFCLACGQSLAVEAPAGEERKVVSVLFVDLVGFTSRSDRADPEDVRATLRPYHERVKADIERFGGTVEKFIGDAVMAVFGAPVAHEDDAERAVRAGLRILETIEELRTEGLQISARAAVTTGEAVVALGARPERGEGIVTGDVVNTAARLQSAAPVGAVLVDETTMRSSGAAVTFEPLEPVEAKGKAEPISVWRAVGARSRVGQPEAATRSPYVGREHEQRLLLETFLRAERESSVQLVTVVGEPGIGKSRLVTELRAALDERPDLITWRHGRCLPYGEGITFWALGEIVKAEAGILESDDQQVAAAKLDDVLSALVSDDSERSWFVARLGPLVGAAGEGAAVGREEAFAAWRRFLEAMAARRPCVFVFEDLHWADDALLEFVEHILDWGPPVPVLLLCTARPELFERSPSWGGGMRNATSIALPPLSTEEAGRLVHLLLDRTVLPAETQTVLLERAGGNPLYAEQFARMLVERGDVANLAVPETVQALVTARLDTLTAELKALLQDASVVGRVFWAGAVAAMAGRPHDDVRRDLNELARREFVRPIRVSSMEGEDEFSFWHALVRDVAYQQIPRSPRAEKHVAAASWVEETAGDRLDDQAEILVHHYGEALALVQAAGDDRPDIEASLLRFLLLAGDRAMSLDIPAADAYYRRALARITDDVERARVLVKLGDALQPQGRLQESEDAYEEGIPVLLEAGESRVAAVAMTNLGRAHWRHGNTVRARNLAFEAVELLEPDPGPELVLAYGRLAAADALGGRSEQAITWANKGIELAGHIGVENIVRPLGMRGIARIDLGDADGMDDLRAAVDVSLALGLPAEDTAIAYGNLGENVRVAEGVAAGRALVEAGLEFARSRGHVHHVMYSRRVLLIHLFHEGRWDHLLAESDEVIEWDRERGGTQIEPWTLADVGLVLAHRGETTKASRLIQAVLPRAREIADPQTILPLLATAALVELAQGDANAAEVLLAEYDERSVRSTGRGDDDVFWLMTVSAALGSVSRAEAALSDEPWSALGRHTHTHGRALMAEVTGEPDEAARLFAEAAHGWQEWGSIPLRAYALVGLGRCSGDSAAFAEGQAIFTRLGATPIGAPVARTRQQQV